MFYVFALHKCTFTYLLYLLLVKFTRYATLTQAGHNKELSRCCNSLMTRVRGTSDDVDHSSTLISIACRSIDSIAASKRVVLECQAERVTHNFCQHCTKQSDYAISAASCRCNVVSKTSCHLSLHIFLRQLIGRMPASGRRSIHGQLIFEAQNINTYANTFN